MRDDFFDEEKQRKGISVTVFIVVIILTALLSSVATYFFIPAYEVKDFANITPTPNAVQPSQNVVVESDMESVFTKLYDDNCDVVVVIDGYVSQNNKEVHYSQSSGLIISEDGYIITNHHCINGISKIMVTLYNGEKYQAEVVGTDERTEVAVIRIKTESKLKPAKLGDSDNVKIGQYAIAIGNPVGFEYSMSIGFISGVEREVDSQNFRFKMIQVDTPLNSGNSGGPLFNSSGEVIGINTMKSSSYTSSIEGIGFAIPINIAKQISAELITNGKVTRAAIQATVGNYDGESGGALVAEVTPGGASETAGIVANDVIVSFNDKKITSVNDLIAELENCKPGDEVEIIVIRNNEETSLKIKLGST